MITKTQQALFAKLPETMQRKILICEQTGCWLWQGEINRNGYGRVWSGGTRYMAHKHAYQIVKGDIAPGKLLDHNCRQRNCCNPTHLSPVTVQQNTHRGKAVLFQRRSPCGE